jgi:hypothetical protein
MTSQNLSFKEVLEKIARDNAMDYEYQRWAREALAALPEPVHDASKQFHEWAVAEHAAQRQRVGLTDGERKKIYDECQGLDVMKAIIQTEANLRENNQ